MDATLTTDLVVIGGGVMGLFTAYHAAGRAERVVVLERGRVGDPLTASYGRTRSFRNDYLDEGYARLAHEAFGGWQAFERETGAEVLVRCGCLNIAKATVTPDLAGSYAEGAHAVISGLGMRTESFDGAQLRERFPYLDADLGRMDLDAGVVKLPVVKDALLAALAQRGVEVREGVETTAIDPEGEHHRVVTDGGELLARAVAVTAGHGTNEVLERFAGARLQVPITKDRPSDARYFAPPPELRDRFTSDAMPVIAYLDTGIYCHPIVEGLVDEVKIGYYNPPDVPRGTTSVDSIPAFLEQCMPGLLGAPSRPVTDYDQCDYDLVDDDEFVLGPIPGVPAAYVGVGWRGTGYKFAPWVGRVLADLALRAGASHDLERFDPARFTTA